MIKMKIFIICSKAFYGNIPPIKEKLEAKGHEIFLPNSYDNPAAEKEAWNLGEKEHAEFKARMFKMSAEKIKSMDAVVTLNFDKNGKIIDLPQLYNRLVCADMQMFRIPIRCAIVADEKKAMATLAALRGGLINALITNTVVASKIIKLDDKEH